MKLSEEDLDLAEVVIACTNGQIGRNAAREIIAELGLAGFEIIRRADDSSSTAENK